jgi:hypothetical protein
MVTSATEVFPRTPFSGLRSVQKKFSSGSYSLSSMILTTTVFSFSPGAKTSLPLA